MTRSSWMIAVVVAGVAAVLLGGALLLFGGRDTVQAGTVPSSVATTTKLTYPPDPSDGTHPPDPYPTVPSAQRRGNELWDWGIRTDADGRRLLVQVDDSDCSSEEARLLGEYPDRVEVEIRSVPTPPPSSITVAPDGSYACMSQSTADGPYAVIELREPLGDRAVVIRREY